MIHPALGPERWLEASLEPDVLAVVGASRDRRKLGHRVILQSRSAGFRGRIYAVNPMLSVPIADAIPVPDVAAIPERVSLALLAVGANQVVEAVEACGKAGVATVVVAASGFAETGIPGARMQETLLDLGHRYHLRIIGPNCYGLYRRRSGLWLISAEAVPDGPIGIATQSGNVTLALLAMAERLGTGFSTVIGLGNQADVTLDEAIQFFSGDPDTGAVAVYMEGIPPHRYPHFLNALDACHHAGKPVVVIKTGRSTRSSELAGTHTASLAGEARLWDAVLRRHQAVPVSSTDDLLDVLRVGLAVPRHVRNVMVITDGGGDSMMALDSLSDTGLQLANLSLATRTALERAVPPAAPRVAGYNPLTLDTAGGLQDRPLLLAHCAELASRDPGVDAVLIGGVFGRYPGVEEEEVQTASHLAQMKRTGTPVLMQSAYAGSPEGTALEVLQQARVPLFESIARMVSSLAQWIDLPRTPSVGASHLVSQTGAVGATWSFLETRALLQAYGVGLPPTHLVQSPDALPTAARDLGFPLCLKAEVEGLIHKSDAGGVLLNLQDESSLMSAADTLWRRFPRARLQVMPYFPPTLEVLVGGITDSFLGPFVTVGRGGIWVEAEADMIWLPCPVAPGDVLDAVKGLRMARLLRPLRGRPALDMDALVKLVVAISHLVAEHPDISVDLNPVFLYPTGLDIADARVFSHQGSDTIPGTDLRTEAT